VAAAAFSRWEDSDHRKRRIYVADDGFPKPEEMRDQFLRTARNPKNIGFLDHPNGQGVAVGKCGDSIEVSLRVESGSISDIKVYPKGCVYTLVCASAMSEMAKGRDLDKALELEPDDVAEALGGLPEDHLHCARLAVNTLGEAIADYYRRASLAGLGHSA
jgi:nitrogen fixation NifU-like protein